MALCLINADFSWSMRRSQALDLSALSELDEPLAFVEKYTPQIPLEKLPEHRVEFFLTQGGVFVANWNSLGESFSLRIFSFRENIINTWRLLDQIMENPMVRVDKLFNDYGKLFNNHDNALSCYFEAFQEYAPLLGRTICILNHLYYDSDLHIQNLKGFKPERFSIIWQYRNQMLNEMVSYFISNPDACKDGFEKFVEQSRKARLLLNEAIDAIKSSKETDYSKLNGLFAAAHRKARKEIFNVLKKKTPETMKNSFKMCVRPIIFHQNIRFDLNLLALRHFMPREQALSFVINGMDSKLYHFWQIIIPFDPFILDKEPIKQVYADVVKLQQLALERETGDEMDPVLVSETPI
jgi:hypothetical protein